jgi:hypothetical protein
LSGEPFSEFGEKAAAFVFVGIVITFSCLLEEEYRRDGVLVVNGIAVVVVVVVVDVVHGRDDDSLGESREEY